MDGLLSSLNFLYMKLIGVKYIDVNQRVQQQQNAMNAMCKLFTQIVNRPKHGVTN